MNYFERFKVAPGSRVRLKDIDPGFKDPHEHTTVDLDLIRREYHAAKESER